MENGRRNELGEILRQQRVMASLTLGELAGRSGVSASHLGRVERGERFPSGRILRRLAKPLGFGENELFALAGYLSPAPSMGSEESPAHAGRQLDPSVARMLAQEPVDVQRTVIGILSIMRTIAGSMKK